MFTVAKWQNSAQIATSNINLNPGDQSSVNDQHLDAYCDLF